MADDKKDKQKQNFDSWYVKNKEEYNAKRRARYASDVKYRKKAIENAENYRKVGPSVERGSKRKAYRTYKGVEVRVFKIGEVAQQIGRSAQTIRLWEEDRLIPKPVFKNTAHRLYTEHQAKLLADFAEVSRNNRNAPQVILQASKRLRSEWMNI